MTLFHISCSTLGCGIFTAKQERPPQPSQSGVQAAPVEMEDNNGPISTVATRKLPRQNHETSKLAALRRQLTSMRAESLCKASESGDIETVKLLLAGGAINPSWSRDPEVAGDMDGTPLRLALEQGHSEIVLELLDDQRLQVNATQKDFELVYADFLRLQKLPESSHDAILQRLLWHPKIAPDWKNEFGQTMLVKAINEGEIDLARTLLERADIHIASNKGCTALHEAAQKDHRLVAELLARGADPSPKTSNLTTPLHWAMRGDFRSIEPLLGSDAEPNALDSHGASPLHYAIFYLSDDVIESQISLLLNAGASPVVRDEYGATPLHRMIRRGHLAVFEKMLASSATQNDLSDWAVN